MSEHFAKPVLGEHEFPQLRNSCKQLLHENIIPFWYPNVIDMRMGGYRLNHDSKGIWKGPANKGFIAQARTFWFFSKLSGTSHGTGEHLEAAHHGYHFIRDCMWDKEHGGFYWEVSATGREVTMPDKHLYAQAFGLYGLAEYIKVTGDSSAVTLADELFRLLELAAHDTEYGGYREFFRRDWSRPPDSRVDYMNRTGARKSMNTHLHLLEAITEYYRVRKTKPAHERLNELIILLSNTFIKKNIAACVEEYQLDWQPVHGTGNDRVSYGHQLENIWMLMEACDASEIRDSTLLTLYRALFDYALQYGFDKNDGGFYHTGTINMPADDRKKVWWVQAESMVCALRMYGLTHEQLYLDCFIQTLDWIVEQQADWEGGDWHEIVTESLKPSGQKAYEWKSPYHNGRAILLCLDLLSHNSEQHSYNC